MKFMKLAVAMACAFAFGNAYAFHDGGVAKCDGCHTMHNSSGNKAMAKPTGSTQFQGYKFLLQGSDDSSTCLNCHGGATLSSYHVLTTGTLPASGPANRTPGGDFAYLTQTFTGVGSRGQTVKSIGERHGHNIVAADFSLVADVTLTVAPGGSYAASALSCASCHDPHSRARVVDANGTIAYPTLGGTATLPIGEYGSYGNLPDANEAVGVYRLLAGSNYSQMSYTSPLAFNADPPVAVAPATYNRTEATTDTRVAYGQGMSEWCANCHRSIHNDTVNTGNTKLIHPAGNAAKLSALANDLVGNGTGTTIAAIYNAYVKSGDFSRTSATGAYDSLVPYEEGTKDIATLLSHAAGTNQVGSKDGPTTGQENVMCLSCHRAHATGFDSLSRWNNSASYLAVDGKWAGTDNTDPASLDSSNGMTMAQYQAAMYDRPATKYAFAQRSLCNKCHAKD